MALNTGMAEESYCVIGSSFNISSMEWTKLTVVYRVESTACRRV